MSDYWLEILLICLVLLFEEQIHFRRGFIWASIGSLMELENIQ